MNPIFTLIESSLAFEYLEGDTREVQSGTYRSIVFPFATVGQVQRRSFWIETNETAAVEIHPNEGYLLCPNIAYTYSVRGSVPPRFVWARVNYRILDTLSLFQVLQCPLRFPAAVGRQFARINRQLHALATDPNKASLQSIVQRKLLGDQLLLLLLNAGARVGEPSDGLPDLKRLLPVLTFIKNNLQQRISRALLAEQVSLSETHFHAFFKKAMGVAPLEFVQQQRMRKAQHLLLQTSDTIAQVAGQVGYEDPFYFSRQFRAMFSMSPSEYRHRGKQMIW